MINIKPKISLVLVLFILSSFVFISPVSADGGIVIYDPDMFRWELQDMDQQLCAINYENGFENMLLSVDVSDLHGEKAVWIFPVPAKPDKTVIDIIKGFPRLWGYDVKRETDETISDAFSVMRLSQVYTFPYTFISMGHMGVTPPGIEKGITVHEHIEKMGLTTELVTAEDGNAFYNYLTNKDLDLPSDLKSILDGYIGEEYSFVVSWISDVEKFKRESAIRDRYGNTINTLGVFIKFPTDEIYFPLKPTSVYGSQKIPILIYVMGHVTPELYPEIKKESQVNYFIDEYYDVPKELSPFFNGKKEIENLNYTKIKIDAPSRYLTEDLWIKDSAPADVVLADFIKRSVWLWGIIFFILSSCLASMFAGVIAFRKDQPSKKKFALFGLWNFLTLIGFWIASLFLRTKKLKPELEQQLKSQGIVVWDNRKILFVFLFTVFFLVITFVFQIVLQSIF